MMSIWKDLLLLHGHIATPAALAVVVGGGPIGGRREEDASQEGPIEPPSPPPLAVAVTDREVILHALRIIGQLR